MASPLLLRDHAVHGALVKILAGRVPRPQKHEPPPRRMGDAFSIKGLSGTLDCLWFPTVGGWLIPSLTKAPGGCMFTASADPKYPTQSSPRMSRMQWLSISRAGSLIRQSLALGSLRQAAGESKESGIFPQYILQSHISDSLSGLVEPCSFAPRAVSGLRSILHAHPECLDHRVHGTGNSHCVARSTRSVFFE